MADKKLQAKDLVGYEVRLNPYKAGMLVDSGNNITLSFFDGGTDRMEIKEDTDMTVISRNLIHGIVRIFKNDKDVSDKFGGPKTSNPKRVPIVEKGMKLSNVDDSKDRAIVNVLRKNNVRDICRYIEDINEFEVLDRMLDLEKQGENLSHQPRAAIVDALTKKIKKTGGVSRVKRDETADEEVTVK